MSKIWTGHNPCRSLYFDPDDHLKITYMACARYLNRFANCLLISSTSDHCNFSEIFLGFPLKMTMTMATQNVLHITNSEPNLLFSINPQNLISWKNINFGFCKGSSAWRYSHSWPPALWYQISAGPSYPGPAVWRRPQQTLQYKWILISLFNTWQPKPAHEIGSVSCLQTWHSCTTDLPHFWWV